MNKLSSLKAFVDLAEMLASFHGGLVDNGMDEDMAFELTMVILEHTLNGAVQR